MITSCNIAFVYKGRVIATQQFDRNTSNLIENIRATAAAAVKTQDEPNDVARQLVLVFKSSDGTRVELESVTDVEFLFGASQDGFATVRVKQVRVKKHAEPQDVSVEENQEYKKKRSVRGSKKIVEDVEIHEDKQDSTESNFDTQELHKIPLNKLIDEETIAKLCELLEALSSGEAQLEVNKVVETSVMKRRSLKRLIHSIIRISSLKGHEVLKHEWIIPKKFEDSYDTWIVGVPEDKLPEAAQQVQNVFKHLVSKRTKLMTDICAKQKSLNKIIKMKHTKPRKAKKNSAAVEETVHTAEVEASKKKEPISADDQKTIAIENTTDEVEKTEKHLRREARIARDLEKYGCETVEQLKQVKRAARISKMLEKYSCLSMEEVREKRLAIKLEKYGVKTVEELKELKKHDRLTKKLHKATQQFPEMKSKASERTL